jgi:anti-sigma factor RsiW
MSDYLDAELGSRRRRRMERHVAECGQCRRLLAGLRALLAVLHDARAPRGVDAGRIADSVRLRLGSP